jgi:hypothetical protein
MIGAIKAVGDWELDVLAVPFNVVDSDGQIFDDSTEYMLDAFSSPAILYHHGIEPGAKNLQKKPTVIGKAVGVEKRADGIHVRVLLDKTLEWARRVWEAAKNGIAVASSDSIAHLARLEVDGKIIPYAKNKPGRVVVWPLAGVSLWDKVEGMFQPASRYALALPAMKAIYRDAGLPFPEIKTNGGDVYADEATRRARVKSLQERAKKLLKQTKGS